MSLESFFLPSQKTNIFCSWPFAPGWSGSVRWLFDNKSGIPPFSLLIFLNKIEII
jgi:hypothetical protein